MNSSNISILFTLIPVIICFLAAHIFLYLSLVIPLIISLVILKLWRLEHEINLLINLPSTLPQNFPSNSDNDSVTSLRLTQSSESTTRRMLRQLSVASLVQHPYKTRLILNHTPLHPRRKKWEENARRAAQKLWRHKMAAAASCDVRYDKRFISSPDTVVS